MTTEKYELLVNGKTVLVNNSMCIFSGTQEIANIHEHYEGLKKSVFAEPDPNLDLIQKNLVPKLNGAILTYSSWQWNRTVNILVYRSVTLFLFFLKKLIF